MFLEGLVGILLREGNRPTLGSTDTPRQFLDQCHPRLVLVWEEHYPLDLVDQFPCVPDVREATVLLGVYLAIGHLMGCAVRDRHCMDTG